MMNDLDAGSQYTADYKLISDSLPGQQLPWLTALRADALGRFSRQGFPSPREEEWKYTNVSAIEKKLFKPADSLGVADIDDEWLQTNSLVDSWIIVLIDGRFSANHSSLEGLPSGVIVTNMANALETCPEKVKSLIGKAVSDTDHGFIHFNTAWFTDGLFLHVPEKTVLAKPVQLLNLATRPESLSTTRNLIMLDAHAEATISETFVGLDSAAYLTAAVTEVFVGCNAELSLYKLQSEAGKAFHFGGTYIKQERDARFKHYSYSFGGLLARNEVHCDLGQGSECELNGLYTGVKQQHIDNHTRINHREPHALSRELYKGVLDQRARGIFQGRVVVFEGAQKTDSEMNNRNLLLSEHAEADTKPQLEIYADDVKCAHGVTVGQLEDKAIFYLQSRGVDEETARNMLTFAFANEMVDKIELENIKSLIVKELFKHFPQKGIVREWL